MQGTQDTNEPPHHVVPKVARHQVVSRAEPSATTASLSTAALQTPASVIFLLPRPWAAIFQWRRFPLRIAQYCTQNTRKHWGFDTHSAVVHGLGVCGKWTWCPWCVDVVSVVRCGKSVVFSALFQRRALFIKMGPNLKNLMMVLTLPSPYDNSKEKQISDAWNRGKIRAQQAKRTRATRPPCTCKKPYSQE